MMVKKLQNLELHGKKILLRADLNVPKHDGRVIDTTRIDRLKPTIDYLRSQGGRILVLSHFGRPDGEKNMQMSLAFLVPALEQSWQTPIKFSPECIGQKAQAVSDSLKDGEIALLENLRFYKGEEDNDSDFISALAALGDVYVNDAFSTSHRAHASTEGLAHRLPCAAGLLMEAELNALEKALGSPQKPVAAIVGGSKISTKLDVLYNLSAKVDFLILGGGMANTFLYAQGANIGNSLCEKNMADEAKKIFAHSEINGCKIILPMDSVTVAEISPQAEIKVTKSDNVPTDRMAIDIGPDSIKYIQDTLRTCKTVVWNGPMGVFEIKPFDHGTNQIAGYVANLTKNNSVVSIAGGGDTVAALENAGIADDFSYISTAGGAFLEWLEGKTLPGVAALQKTS